MINQLGTGRDESIASPLASGTSNVASNVATTSLAGTSKETTEIDPTSLANSFLSSLSGSRPRRFSASFSPVSNPNPVSLVNPRVLATIITFNYHPKLS